MIYAYSTHDVCAGVCGRNHIHNKHVYGFTEFMYHYLIYPMPNPPVPLPTWQYEDHLLLVMDKTTDQVEGHTSSIVVRMMSMCLRYPDHSHKTILIILKAIKRIQHITDVSIKECVQGVWRCVEVGSVTEKRGKTNVPYIVPSYIGRTRGCWTFGWPTQKLCPSILGSALGTTR